MDASGPQSHYYRHLCDTQSPWRCHHCGSGCHGHHVPHELPEADDELSETANC